jgi:hypothetical protein
MADLTLATVSRELAAHRADAQDITQLLRSIGEQHDHLVFTQGIDALEREEGRIEVFLQDYREQLSPTASVQLDTYHVLLNEMITRLRELRDTAANDGTHTDLTAVLDAATTATLQQVPPIPSVMLATDVTLLLDLKELRALARAISPGLTTARMEIVGIATAEETAAFTHWAESTNGELVLGHSSSTTEEVGYTLSDLRILSLQGGDLTALRETFQRLDDHTQHLLDTDGVITGWRSRVAPIVTLQVLQGYAQQSMWEHHDMQKAKSALGWAVQALREME